MIRRLVPAPDPGRPPRPDPVPAASDDDVALAELDRVCFGPAAWSEQLWHEECARLGADRIVLVVRAGLADRRPLAAVVLSVPPAPEPVDLTRLAVTPDSRGHGLGGRLVAAALAAVPDRTMLLEVAEDNHVARRLYERHGFTEIGRRPRYYADVAAVILQHDTEIEPDILEDR